MDYKQVIEASATVIRIAELKKGNVVKLVDDKDNDAELAYGIVEDVLNDGERGYIQFLTVRKSYYGAELSRRVIGTKSTKVPAVFPATVEEIKTYFDNIERTLEKEIKDKEKSLVDANEKLSAFRETRNVESSIASTQYAV